MDGSEDKGQQSPAKSVGEPLSKGTGGSDSGDREGGRWWSRLWAHLRIRWQSDLDRYKAREELTWEAESKELQSLTWLLRMHHAEARGRARRTGLIVALITFLATAVSSLGVYVTWRGWVRLFEFVNKSENPRIGYVIPERLWELGLATTGAVLLIAGGATLLFNVARNQQQVYLVHTREMDVTRRIEAAVRLALSSRVAKDKEVRSAFEKLAEQLLRPQNVEAEYGAELSAMPEIVKALRELVETVLKSKSGT